MDFELTELCSLDLELYKCVSPEIATSRVVLTEKSVIHIAILYKKLEFAIIMIPSKGYLR